MSSLYAPGARVVIRDCEWIVRRADPSDDGGYILTVDGLSELVNGKSARFLTLLEEAENAIRVLDPAETCFEQDLTPGFEKSRLFIETQLRQITPADEKIHLGHKAAMDPVPYQLDPALKQNRQRILIADAVGMSRKANKKGLSEGIFCRIDITKRRRHSPRLGRHPAPAGGQRLQNLPGRYPPRQAVSTHRGIQSPVLPPGSGGGLSSGLGDF